MQPRHWLKAAAAAAIAAALITNSTPAMATLIPASPVTVSMAKKATPTLKVSTLKRASGTGKLYVGEKVKLTGTTSKSLYKNKVVLQRLSGKKWVSAGATSTVSKAGTFSLSAKTTASGKISYRVSTAATKTLNGAVSRSTSIAINKKSTPVLKISSISKDFGSGPIMTGDRIAIEGTASKSLAGKTLTLQRLASGKWIDTSVNPKLTANGSFRISSISQGLGNTSYRVVSKSTTSLNAASSNTVKAKLHQWFNLSELNHGNRVGIIDSNSSIPMAGGGHYRHSMLGTYPNTHFVSYSLGNNCARFRSTIGMYYASAPVSAGVFVVSVNSVERARATVGFGNTKALDVDIAGAYSIKLSGGSAVMGNSPKYTGNVWGSPQVLCSARPTGTGS